jgi:hypothetical protein
MRLIRGFILAATVLILISDVVPAQGQMDSSHAVPGGGITAPGWTGEIDAGAQQAGQTIKDTKLTQEGNKLQVTTGPAAAFWKPANMAAGDYTVSATFTEAKYMNLNNHPHPYGVFIAGHDLGGALHSELYCAAYGDGRFIVRGFGPEPFQMNGHGEANGAVHKAAGPGEPVEQKIALSVKGDKVECAINGMVVATYDKSALVTPGKLKSTDGVYGIRFAHNTEGTVSDLKMTKP